MGTTTDTLSIQTSGITANIATDYVGTGGISGHYQMIKLAYGVDGSATMVNTGNPLPVSVSGGMTATISGFSGPITVQGSGGGAVAVSGSLTVTGLTSNALWVRTVSGNQVEVTGGRYISKTNDAISVWGPSGITYIYAHLVGSGMTSVGLSGDALKVALVGAGISANVTLSSTVGVTNDVAGNGLRIQGMSGGTSVSVTVGNTLNISETNIANGVTAMYSKLVDVYSALSAFGLVRPSGATYGKITVTNSSNTQVSSGFTCYSGVNIKSASYNKDIVYVGDSSLTTNGYELDPGEQLFLNVGNANVVYLRAKSASQIVSYHAS
jgi:hypothetical protein